MAQTGRDGFQAMMSDERKINKAPLSTNISGWLRVPGNSNFPGVLGAKFH
jgi:hypothetical protein